MSWGPGFSGAVGAHIWDMGGWGVCYMKTRVIPTGLDELTSKAGWLSVVRRQGMLVVVVVSSVVRPVLFSW